MPLAQVSGIRRQGVDRQQPFGLGNRPVAAIQAFRDRSSTYFTDSHNRPFGLARHCVPMNDRLQRYFSRNRSEITDLNQRLAGSC